MRIRKFIGKIFHKISIYSFKFSLYIGYSHEDMYNDYYKRKPKK